MAVFGTSTKTVKHQKGPLAILVIGIINLIGIFHEIKRILLHLKNPAGMYLLFGNAKSVEFISYQANWQNSCKDQTSAFAHPPLRRKDNKRGHCENRKRIRMGCRKYKRDKTEEATAGNKNHKTRVAKTRGAQKANNS
jgi:hypothetical protein